MKEIFIFILMAPFATLYLSYLFYCGASPEHLDEITYFMVMGFITYSFIFGLMFGAMLCLQ